MFINPKFLLDPNPDSLGSAFFQPKSALFSINTTFLLPSFFETPTVTFVAPTKLFLTIQIQRRQAETSTGIKMKVNICGIPSVSR